MSFITKCAHSLTLMGRKKELSLKEQMKIV